MKPSEERRLKILSFLSKFTNIPSSDDISKLFLELKNVYTSDKIFEELISMDCKHDGLLQVEFAKVIGGPPVLNISDANTWISSAGEDYLFSLTQAQTNSTSKTATGSYNFSGPVNFNGTPTLGNIETQNVSNFTDNSQTWNTDNSIHQLLNIKKDLNSIEDKQTLQELANKLHIALDSNEPPRSGSFKSFSPFIGKVWGVISPVLTPILVELAKRKFF